MCRQLYSLFVIVAVIVGGANTLRATTLDSSSFQFMKPIRVDDSIVPTAILRMSLDSEIYAVAALDFHDIRIIDETGCEIPFAIEHAVEPRMHNVPELCDSTVESLVERSDNRIEINVVISEPSVFADRVRLVTSLRDYERRVTVMGQFDDGQWTTLVSDAMVFDLSRFMDIGQSDIALPKNQVQRLKIVIADVTDDQFSLQRYLVRHLNDKLEVSRTESTNIKRRPFRVERIELWRDVRREASRSPREMDYDDAGFTIDIDRDAGATIVDVRMRREPITAFTLMTPNRYFSRSVQVMIPTDAPGLPAWTSVATTKLSRFDTAGADVGEVTIRFPEQRAEEYRIVVADDNNLPLAIDGIRATGHVYDAVFVHDEERSYRTLYASEHVQPAKYDTSDILSALRERNVREDLATAGEQMVWETFRRRSSLRVSSILGHPAFFLATAIFVVVTLVFVLIRTTRRIDALSESSRS